MFVEYFLLLIYCEGGGGGQKLVFACDKADKQVTFIKKIGKFIFHLFCLLFIS